MALDILIVDDSAAIRKILQRVLVQAEVAVGKVHEAADGEEALIKLEEGGGKVGLIFSDINMPKMDGIELLGRVRAQAAYREVPFIVITTEGSQQRVLQAIELGANGYVRKPFTPEQIKEKLVGLV
jgi:two-component system, chemotaxis family, chemotaxis protein CheY